MGSSRRKFSKEFKQDAVQRLRAGESAGLVARSLEVNRQELYRWSRDVDGIRAATAGAWLGASFRLGRAICEP
jgi:transposase-like protein